MKKMYFLWYLPSAALRYDQSVNSNPIINIENNGDKKVVDHGTVKFKLYPQIIFKLAVKLEFNLINILMFEL